MKKEGYKGLTGVWRQKPCKRIGGKQQKNDWKPWSIEEREREKFLKKFESDRSSENSKF